MKHKAFYFIAVFAVLTSAAVIPAIAASSDSTSLTLSGVAGKVCKLSGQTAGTATDNASYSNGDYSINAFIDENTAFPKASSGTVTLTQAYCNYATTIEIASVNKGLKNNSSQIAPSDFIKVVGYTVAATWGSVTLPVLDTANTPDGKVVLNAGAANKGDIVLSIHTPDLQIPALEGLYTDTLTIKIGALI